MFTQEDMRLLFNYDSASGDLRWRGNRGRNKMSGCVAGTVRKDGYRLIKIDGCNYLAHRIVWTMVHGECPKLLDHIDMNPSNNRIENLRAASHSLNKANRTMTAANTSGFKGVTFDKRRGRSKPWKSQIKQNYKLVNIGSFATPEEAHAAYAAAANRLFGEFARAA